MLQCLSISSSSSSQPASAPTEGPIPHPPPSEAHNLFVEMTGRGTVGRSTSGTPQSSGILSPVNIHREYALALESDSYREIWTLFHEDWLSSHDQELHVHTQEARRILRLREALRPDTKVVKEALSRVRHCELTNLLSAYFDESEKATELFIVLHTDLQRARAIYTPLHNLLSVVPLDSEDILTSHFRIIEEIFIQFNQDENLLPFTGSNTFKPMRDCSLELKKQLVSCVKKSRSRARLVRRATSKSCLCLIGTSAIAAVSAAAVTAHCAIVAAAAAPCIISCPQPRKFVERELSRAVKLDEAARVVYALYMHLETVDRLMERLQTAIEGDRCLVQRGLERSGDGGSTLEVLKHLKKSPGDFFQHLDHLMVDTCIWFTTVNKARELLFQEICARAEAS
ncbi:hypothetical protein SAY87_007262 [Trapa incisa]|uniref:Uncharacterized protein n=1 Tax=Trapa incisa TaxID=236973 RepID=A0AAN7K433_9MYRT|nr:hypothetical protein SAY87_007262 [Trapa incisa]